jgi:hypothetical protein
MAGTGITRFTEFAANRDDNRRRLEESLRAEKLAKQKLAIEIASMMVQQEREQEAIKQQAWNDALKIGTPSAIDAVGDEYRPAAYRGVRGADLMPDYGKLPTQYMDDIIKTSPEFAQSLLARGMVAGVDPTPYKSSGSGFATDFNIQPLSKTSADVSNVKTDYIPPQIDLVSEQRRKAEEEAKQKLAYSPGVAIAGFNNLNKPMAVANPETAESMAEMLRSMGYNITPPKNYDPKYAAETEYKQAQTVTERVMPEVLRSRISVAEAQVKNYGANTVYRQFLTQRGQQLLPYEKKALDSLVSSRTASAAAANARAKWSEQMLPKILALTDAKIDATNKAAQGLLSTGERERLLLGYTAQLNDALMNKSFADGEDAEAYNDIVDMLNNSIDELQSMPTRADIPETTGAPAPGALPAPSGINPPRTATPAKATVTTTPKPASKDELWRQIANIHAQMPVGEARTVIGTILDAKTGNPALILKELKGGK